MVFSDNENSIKNKMDLPGGYAEQHCKWHQFQLTASSTVKLCKGDCCINP